MIITLEGKNDIVNALKNNLVDTDRYVCLIANDNSVVIKPTVTTKGRDTFVLIKLTAEEVKDIEALFPKRMHVREITFRDENFQPWGN